jgi:Tfp pilus assembly protein PilF
MLCADLSQHPAEAMQIIGQRFFARGDRRIGFYTLLTSSGLTWDPQTAHRLDNGAHVWFDPAADHADSMLAQYIFLHQQQMTRRGNVEQMDLAGKSESGFIQELAALRDLYVRATSEGKPAGRDADPRALEFVRHCDSPLFGWAALSLYKDHNGNAESHRAWAEACSKYAKLPSLSYAARYETAHSLARAGDWVQARATMRHLYQETLGRGLLPPIDQRFHYVYSEGQGIGGKEEQALLRESAETLMAQDARPAVIALAWQCYSINQQALADELLATALAGQSDQDRVLPSLVGVSYLWQTGQYARADALLETVLKDPELAKRSTLWRLAAALAEKLGKTAGSATCLDRALDIEYMQLPEETSLDAVRFEFGALLGRYEQLANSIATVETVLPPDIVARVVRAADRWRSLDPDGTAACHTAARVLRRLGMPDLAWEYVTTPFAARPDEAPEWSTLAGTLRGQGEFELAAQAYRSAFAAQTSNAQILWDHAQMLEQLGKSAAARQLYRQLADGQWGAEFQAIGQQARKLLESE